MRVTTRSCHKCPGTGVVNPAKYASLVEKFPGICSVEPAPASCRKNFGRHQSSVHTHAIRRLSRRGPVRHTAAVPTTVELNRFAVPTIAIGGLVTGDDVYLGGRVVGPQNTIASTNGAIAFCDLSRRDVDLQFNCTAMAGGFDHDSPLRNLYLFASDHQAITQVKRSEVLKARIASFPSPRFDIRFEPGEIGIDVSDL